MASMWEIHDPSNLRYDTDFGYTLADSGFGPPNWSRLDSHGSTASGVTIPGVGNCNAWTSADVGDSGTIVTLYGVIGTTPEPPSARGLLVRILATFPRRVWCVQD